MEVLGHPSRHRDMLRHATLTAYIACVSVSRYGEAIDRLFLTLIAVQRGREYLGISSQNY
jgi:hypothetical protein